MKREKLIIKLIATISDKVNFLENAFLIIDLKWNFIVLVNCFLNPLGGVIVFSNWLYWFTSRDLLVI